MRTPEFTDRHIGSVSAYDVKCVVDGLVAIAEDTLLRDMELGRDKLAAMTQNLKIISKILETLGSRIEILERQVT